VDNQNGAVDVRSYVPAGKPCARIQLKTSFGPIRLALDPQGGYSVTARTSFGKVSTELPIGVSGSIGGDALTGRIGDGRCEVRLTDSNGNIELVKATGAGG
jgi:hypothetical protein